MQVIRIEHKESENGIFMHKTEWGYFAMTVLPTLFRKHCSEFPVPNQESNVMFLKNGMKPKKLELYKDNKIWFCAYKTIEQLQEWFTKYQITTIIQHGFNIWLLEVSEFQEGNYQILYTKESIISKQKINSLFF